MFCRECGKMIQDGNKFCTGCGTKVQPISMKTNVESVNNSPIVEGKNQITNTVNYSNNNNYSNSNYNNQNNTATTNLNDKNSIGFNILAFFIPIAGLILFLFMKKETPKKAKGIGISALVGYILSIIVSILYVAFILLLTFTNLEYDLDSDWQDYDYEYNEYYDDYDYDFERDYEFDGNYNI